MNIVIHDLFELCRGLSIDLGKGLEFSYDKFYKYYDGIVIGPLWGERGYVIGLLINSEEWLYPFKLEDFRYKIESINNDKLVL